MLGIGFFTGLAGFVVLLSSVAIAYALVWPVASEFYNRNPWFGFPRESLRVRTLREEVRANSYRWLLNRLLKRPSLWTYWSFIWVLPVGLAIVFSLAYLTAPFELGTFGSISTGWQAHLTITSLSFIVLIFLLDQIYRSRYREGVIQAFLASSKVMPVLYFSLFSSGVLSYLYFYHTPEDVSPILLDATFFVFLGTITGIGYVYYRVARLISADPLDEMTVQQIQRGLQLQLQERDRQEISNSYLQDALPEFVSIDSNRDNPVLAADDLDLDGYVSDIHLGKLADACEQVAADLEDEQELLIDIGLGAEMQTGIDVVSISSGRLEPSDVSGNFVELLSSAVYCSSEPAWPTGDQLVDRNMAQIGETTRTAIHEGNPQGLEKNLKRYTGLLEHATELNRRVADQYGGTPVPISSHVDQIYREFYRILEAAARTGVSDLIRTVRAEIMRLSMMFHRQDEPHLFDRTIGLYGSYYRVLASNPDVGRDPIHTILVNLDNLQTMLTASLKRVRSVDEAEDAISDIESLYELFETFFRISIEVGDAETFNNIWDMGGGDAFITVSPETEIHDLEWSIQQSDDPDEIQRLESELEIKQKQQEAIGRFSSRFGEVRFIASAWAYQSVQEDILGEQIFQEMFSESIKHYSFEELSKVYLELCGTPRLDLMRWESEDSDVFKGVQSSRPATDTWLKEFFCAMGLLTLDPETFDTDDLDEGDNPMAGIEIDRSAYPELEETIQGISREELLSTGIAESELEDLDERKDVMLALHHQMEEILERREEDHIIDSDLDSEKVEDFKQSYISEFEGQFVLRQALDDIDWLLTEEYDEDLDINPSGSRAFYPKHGFIPDPPSEFIHNLEQRVRNHIDFLTNDWFIDEREQLDEAVIENYDVLPEELGQICSNFEEQEEPVQAIIIGDFRALSVIRDSTGFDDEFRQSDEVVGGFSFDGYTIPVYRDSTGDFAALVLAGEGQPVCLTEYRRDDETVFVDIQKVTRELLEDLDEEEFEGMSEEEIREKLQTVLLDIFYYGEIEVTSNFGTLISIDN